MRATTTGIRANIYKVGRTDCGMLFQARSNTDFSILFIIYCNYSACAIPQGAFAMKLNSCYYFRKKARISFSEACTDPVQKERLTPLPFNTAFISFVN